jgi:hypothetical protein
MKLQISIFCSSVIELLCSCGEKQKEVTTKRNLPPNYQAGDQGEEINPSGAVQVVKHERIKIRNQNS